MWLAYYLQEHCHAVLLEVQLPIDVKEVSSLKERDLKTLINIKIIFCGQ